ncbi:hypothetical protein RAS2_31140 [Phycisphaerae bacterium RAS2]|nr:hypothetical protein RAS2_31140 [Phycisphaerae bacterium RAS2]
MRNTHLVIAVGFVSCATSALAEIVVWQTAMPLSANAFIAGQGNGYTRLDLGCNATVGECKWKITTQVFIADGTLRSYSLSIRDPAGAATQLSVSESSFAGAPFTNVFAQHENMPPFLSYLSAGLFPGQPDVPAGPTVYNLHSYVLTSQAGIAPGTLTQLRGGSNGFVGFEPFDPLDSHRITAFGANPGFDISSGEWPNPVIHINYVPEPTTAAMLLAPAVLLMRRRRSRGRTLRQ